MQYIATFSLLNRSPWNEYSCSPSGLWVMVCQTRALPVAFSRGYRNHKFLDAVISAKTTAKEMSEDYCPQPEFQRAVARKHILDARPGDADLNTNSREPRAVRQAHGGAWTTKTHNSPTPDGRASHLNFNARSHENTFSMRAQVVPTLTRTTENRAQSDKHVVEHGQPNAQPSHAKRPRLAPEFQRAVARKHKHTDTVTKVHPLYESTRSSNL